MIGKLKDHVDKVVAVVIILACLGVVVSRLVPSGEQSIKPDEIEKYIKGVEEAIRNNKPKEEARPDCVQAFAENMSRTEQLVPDGRVAWAIWPQPPFVLGKTPVGPVTNLIAKLVRPVVTPGGVWVGRAVLKVSFGADDRWQARALQVWRKAAGEADWPAEPFVTIKVTADGAAALPAGVSAVAGGYDIKIEDLKARVPCEYRARVAAVFPAQGKVETGGKTDIRDIEAPKDSADFLAEPDEGRRKALESLLVGGGAVKLLAGGPFVTRFSEPAKLELPGDVQVRLVMMESDEEGKYIRGSFAMRRWLQSLDQWVEKNERIDIGKDIKGEQQKRNEAGKMVKYQIDADATLVDLKVEMRAPPPVKRQVPKRDPKTGKVLQPLEMVEEEFVGPPRRVQLAVIKDKRSGQNHELIAGPDEWWPKDMQLAPKAEVKPPVAPGPAVAPGPGPVVAPAPVPNPPVVAPAPVPPPPAPGPVNPAVPPGPGPGVPPPPAGKGPAVDLTKPLPPDASVELKQAYEQARQEAERKRQQQQSSGLR